MEKNKIRRIAFLIFGIVFFSNLYFSPAIDYDNSKSRYFLLSAMVDYKQLTINQYEKNTIDKSIYKGNYYSNKAFGGPLLASPFYWLMRKIPLKLFSHPLNLLSRSLVTIITTSLISAICSVLMWFLAIKWKANPLSSLIMVLAFSFGTITWIHATMFTGHVMASSLLFIGFYTLWIAQEKFKENSSSNNNFSTIWVITFLAGLLIGLSGLCDYVVLSMYPAIVVYVFMIKINWKLKVSFFTGFFLCASLLLLYNWYCFDSPFSLSYAHNANEEFAKRSQSGFLGVNLPNFFVLFKLLFSPARGLFFIMPIFLFSIFGMITFYKSGKFKKEFWLIISICICNLLLNAGFYGWHSGWSLGSRYLIAMMPFLALFMAFTSLNNNSFYIVLSLSIFHIFPGVVFFPYWPTQIVNPQIELLFPLIKSGYLGFNLGMLLGLGKYFSIYFYLCIIIGLILYLFRFVFKNGNNLDEIQSPIYCKVISLSAAVLICVGLVFAKTDPLIVNAYQKVLMKHYLENPKR